MISTVSAYVTTNIYLVHVLLVRSGAMLCVAVCAMHLRLVCHHLSSTSARAGINILLQPSVGCTTTCQLYNYLSAVQVPVSCTSTCHLYNYLSIVQVPVSCTTTCQLYKYLSAVQVPVSCITA